MEITLAELKDLYYNNSNKYVAEYLGVSVVTLLKILKDNNVELKGRGNGTEKTKVRVIS